MWLWVCVPGGPVGRVGQEGFTGAKDPEFQPSGLLQEGTSAASLPFLSCLPWGKLRLDPDSSSGMLCITGPPESKGQDRLACGSAAPRNLASWASEVKDWSEGEGGQWRLTKVSEADGF